MLHARTDYNRIQDPENKIGEKEPVMLFRAKDMHFIGVLQSYLSLLAREGNRTDLSIVEAVQRHIQRAKGWQATNETKHPDMPKDVILLTDK